MEPFNKNWLSKQCVAMKSVLMGFAEKKTSCWSADGKFNFVFFFPSGGLVCPISLSLCNLFFFGKDFFVIAFLTTCLHSCWHNLKWICQWLSHKLLTRMCPVQARESAWESQTWCCSLTELLPIFNPAETPIFPGCRQHRSGEKPCHYADFTCIFKDL